MTTEHASTEGESDLIHPPVADKATREAPPARKVSMTPLINKEVKTGSAKVAVDGEMRITETPEARTIRREEDLALHEWLKSVADGTGHLFKISRDYPMSHNGVNTAGHLETVGEFFTEEELKDRHGGGTFRIRVMNPTAKGGHINGPGRTIKIAGEPKIGGLTMASPGGAAPVIMPDKAGEKAQDRLANMLEGELKHARERLERPREDGISAPMIAMLQNTINGLQAALTEANRRADAAANTKPVEDPFKQKMIETLMSEEGTRVQGVRMMYESEIRQLKEGQSAQESRLRDAFERDKQMIHMSTEREIQTVRQSSEIALSSVKMSFETQIEILKAENRRMERTIIDQNTEIKELRAKKDKSLPEQVKEMKELKDLLGVGEEAVETTADKVIGVLTNPAAIEFAQVLLKGNPAAAAQAQQAQQQQAAQQAQQPFVPKIVRDAKGNRFAVGPAGELVPIKKKKLTVSTGATEAGQPTEVQIPHIEPERIQMVVTLLESAFSSGTDPDTLIQSYRIHIPDEVVEAIRELKVDGFMTRVAKLPATSPLKSQAGRVWLRKVGDALLGEITPEP